MALPIRICHVSLTLKTGGLERLLAGMAKHRDPKKTEMTFYCLREEGRFADEIRKMGFEVQLVASKTRVQLVRRLAKRFRGNFDIVHTHNTYPLLYAATAAKMAGVPIIVNTRHSQRARHSFQDGLLYRMAAACVDRIVAVSNDAAECCIREDRIPNSKVCRIWNGIDANEFVYTGPIKQPIAITVGRLVPEKGYANLLQAVGKLQGRVPGFRLRIVGDGPLRASLTELAKSLQIESMVEFLGERSDIPSLLAQSGFYISSSITEGISLTLLEAMAVGLPVIGTRAGGNPEIIQDPTTGLLVPTADPDAMANAIARLSNELEGWDGMGRAARMRIEEHFEVRGMTRAYESLYEELLGMHRPART